jgi:hypothetical protein
MSLPISYDTRDPSPHLRCQTIANERKITPKEAEAALKWEMTPRAYIFAFMSEMRTSAIREVVSAWYDARGESISPFRPYLPRLIAAPGTVGIQDDGWINFNYPAENVEQMHRAHGPNSRFVMPFYPTHRHFGWLALHLMHTVHARLGPRSAESGMPLLIDQFLPVNLYGNELREGEPSLGVVWSDKNAPTSESGPATSTSTPR